MIALMRDWMRNHLAVRVLLAMIVTITLVLAGWTAITTSQMQTRLTKEILAQGQTQIAILESATNRYVAEGDTGQLILVAGATTSHDMLQYIAFYDTSGALLAATAAPNSPLDVRTPFNDLRTRVLSTNRLAEQWTDSYLDIAAPIIWVGQTRGVIAIRLETSELQEARRAALVTGILSSTVLICLLSLIMGFLLRQLVLRPLLRLSEATDAINTGRWVLPTGQDRHDEFGRMSRSFAQMVTTLQRRETELFDQVRVVEDLNTMLDQKVRDRTAELSTMVETQERLLVQIHHMSIPVIPILKGVIIVPLIGTLDSTRSQHFIENVLSGIEQHQARLMILDITGVPVVDNTISQMLIQVVQITRLMGCSAVLVGISPEVAQTIIQLEVNLHDIQPFATLQDALQALVLSTAIKNPPQIVHRRP